MMSRLWELLRPRLNAGQAIIGVLCVLLGFGFATQVQANQPEAKFATARQDELLGILDDLTQRHDRLRADLQGLRDTKAKLEGPGGEAALEDARRREAAYGVLAGTLPATGPGIELIIQDPAGKVGSSQLVDTVTELRNAGAEVIQINEVRAVASTHFTDVEGGVVVCDGVRLSRPFRLLVIGDSKTLSTALAIPGGVIESLRGKGAKGEVISRPHIDIQATRSAATRSETPD